MPNRGTPRRSTAAPHGVSTRKPGENLSNGLAGQLPDSIGILVLHRVRDGRAPKGRLTVHFRLSRHRFGKGIGVNEQGR
ncbi:MAG: hypothetical protein JRH16_21685 [Deltaproteobacteria bacterium]|nr:hypothetical protein [Deltaproteobacteria bacterium]